MNKSVIDTEQTEQDAGSRTAELAAALAHPARISILKQLACRDACCCKDVVQHMDLAQSTVSQHLKVLVQAGLVTYEPARPKSRYSLNRQALMNLSSAVSDLVEQCCCAPDESAMLQQTGKEQAS